LLTIQKKGPKRFVIGGGKVREEAGVGGLWGQDTNKKPLLGVGKWWRKEWKWLKVENRVNKRESLGVTGQT